MENHVREINMEQNRICLSLVEAFIVVGATSGEGSDTDQIGRNMTEIDAYYPFKDSVKRIPL